MINNIFHIDMDSFFPSVEALYNPKLKDIPMVVGHRVVSSANYLARNLGIKSAMKLIDAKKIYPSLVVVEPNMSRYIKISNRINDFLKSQVMKVESGSIDEWYIDTNNSRFENWNEFEFASYLKHEIKNKFELNCSIGNSFTTFLAKMATNICKPNGFITLSKDNFKSYIYDLPVSKIIGIGPSSSKILEDFDIKKISDIAKLEKDFLIRKKMGISWSKIKMNVLGIKYDNVNPDYKRKNIGRSVSIRGFTEYIEFRELISDLCKDLNTKLSWNDFVFKSVNLKLKLIDKQSFTKTLNFQDYAKKIPLNKIFNLFEKLINPELYEKIINLSITVNDLLENKNLEQLNLFESVTVKLSQENDLERIKNNINKKLNKKIIVIASEKHKKLVSKK